MTVYVDSSSLVKLYVDEVGSEATVALVQEATVVATATIAYAEVRAAFARKRRERSLTPRELARVREQFDVDWATILAVTVGVPLAKRAGELAEAHSLRGADAIHLAAFERVLASATDDVHFSSADDALSRAALRLG